MIDLIISVLPSFRFIINPGAGGAENQSRKESDDQQHEPSHGASVAHLELIKGFVVQMNSIIQRGVQRFALGDQVAGVERLESADHLVDEVEEDNGGQQRKRNGKESAHRAGAVHDGGFIIA